MAKTTRYTFTAAIGDAVPGDVIELTNEQAESPLYASRITLGGSVSVDADDVLAEARASADAMVAEAEDKAAQIVSDAEAKAKEIVSAAQAEAMKLATAPKK